MSASEKLMDIQQRLKVEKSQFNSFGKYKYRTKEDILEAVKPLASELKCTVVCDDSIECLPNGWVYVKTTAMLTDIETSESVCAHGNAREPESKKGMDASQITGTASSYAGKRALGNLFAIDDTADADSGAYQQPESPDEGPFLASCRSCGLTYQFQNKAHFDQFKATASCCANPMWEAK